MLKENEGWYIMTLSFLLRLGSVYTFTLYGHRYRSRTYYT